MNQDLIDKLVKEIFDPARIQQIDGEPRPYHESNGRMYPYVSLLCRGPDMLSVADAWGTLLKSFVIGKTLVVWRVRPYISCAEGDEGFKIYCRLVAF